MALFKIYLKDLEDGHIVVKANSEKDARSKIKQLFKKAAVKDVTDNFIRNKSKIVSIDKEEKPEDKLKNPLMHNPLMHNK